MAIEMISRLKHHSYEDRMRECGCSAWKSQGSGKALQHLPVPKQGLLKKLERDKGM